MKPLAGKRWFYSLGWRMFVNHHGCRIDSNVPMWAIRAFERGYEDARWAGAVHTVKQWPVSKLAGAA